MLCPFTVYCQVGIFFIFSLLLPGFWWHWTKESVSVFVSRQQIFPELHPGLPLSFLSWAYILQGVYFWAYVMPGVSIFGVFVHQAFPVA